MAWCVLVMAWPFLIWELSMFDFDFSNQAIVRGYVPGQERILPGMLVYTTPRAFAREGRFGSFLFAWTRMPDLIFNSTPELFLDYKLFLKLCPINDFWSLASRDKFKRGNPGYFLSDAEGVKFGSFPFRFESLGEARHYVEKYRLNMDDFFVSHTQLLKLPQFQR
jgi:hypothetical protein